MPFTAPRFADVLLRRLLTSEDAEVIAGDLHETAATLIAPHRGPTAARWWYRRQVLSIVLARATPHFDVRPPRISMAALRQDLCYAARSLRKQPAFTTMAIAMLALGIGATVAIFALVNAVMLKPLPFADPDRLMLAGYIPARRATRVDPLTTLRAE